MTFSVPQKHQASALEWLELKCFPAQCRARISIIMPRHKNLVILRLLVRVALTLMLLVCMALRSDTPPLNSSRDIVILLSILLCSYRDLFQILLCSFGHESLPATLTGD